VTDLADRLEILELSARYNLAVDDARPDDLVALFTADATLTIAPAGTDQRRYSGRDEIRTIGERPPGQFVHVTTGDVVTIEGERARHVCSLIVLRPLPEGGTALVNQGRYHSKLVRTGEGWRFTSRTAALGRPGAAQDVEVLPAERAIRRALQNYCRGIDRLDRELLASAWHPGATVDYVGAFTGTAEELVDFFMELHLEFSSHSHQVTNLTVEVQGDAAVSEAYVTARLRRTEPDTGREIDHVVAGRYLDRWSKRDGAWAIDHRTYYNDVHSHYEVVGGLGWNSRRDRKDAAYALFAGW
jgi:SnoaL-like protein